MGRWRRFLVHDPETPPRGQFCLSPYLLGLESSPRCTVKERPWALTPARWLGRP